MRCGSALAKRYVLTAASAAATTASTQEAAATATKPPRSSHSSLLAKRGAAAQAIVDGKVPARLTRGIASAVSAPLISLDMAAPGLALVPKVIGGAVKESFTNSEGGSGGGDSSAEHSRATSPLRASAVP